MNTDTFETRKEGWDKLQKRSRGLRKKLWKEEKENTEEVKTQGKERDKTTADTKPCREKYASES